MIFWQSIQSTDCPCKLKCVCLTVILDSPYKVWTVQVSWFVYVWLWFFDSPYKVQTVPVSWNLSVWLWVFNRPYKVRTVPVSSNVCVWLSFFDSLYKVWTVPVSWFVYVLMWFFGSPYKVQLKWVCLTVFLCRGKVSSISYYSNQSKAFYILATRFFFVLH